MKLRRWIDYLTAPVDGASLAAFRFCFGALILWEVGRYALYGRIYAYYIEPGFFFSYLPFLKPWGGTGMYWHFAALGVLAVLCALGALYRVSAALLCAAFTYVFLLDKAQYLNHLYLVCLVSFLLALLPAHRTLSLDSWRARRRHPHASVRDETVPRFCLLVLKAQIALVYFYGGIAKLNRDWLRGEPLTTWLLERSDAPVLGPFVANRHAGLFMSYAGLFIDLSMGFLLFSRRTFALGAALALLFNLTNKLLFNIGIFPWFMIASLVLFADPSWPRRRLAFLFPKPSPPPAVEQPPRGRAVTLALLHGYMLIQLVVPLRHWLEPGDVAWNETGHRFSWRMKLRDKRVSELRVDVVDPRTGFRETLDLEEWLTSRQIDEMSTRPDMLVDFAHHVAAEWQRAFGVRPAVTAKVVVSLNGGPWGDLFDPTSNLAAPREGLLGDSW